MVIQGYPIVGLGSAVFAVPFMKDIDPGSINGDQVIPVKESPPFENSSSNKGPDHGGWQLLQLIWIKVGKGGIQSIAMRDGWHSEEGPESGFGCFGMKAILDLAHRLKSGKEKKDPGEKEAGQWIIAHSGHARIFNAPEEFSEIPEEMVKGLEKNLEDLGPLEKA